MALHAQEAPQPEGENADTEHDEDVPNQSIGYVAEEFDEGETRNDQGERGAAIGQKGAFVGQHGAIQGQPVADDELTRVEVVVGQFGQG